MKTTELGLLLQVLPVRIITFVETLGSHLKGKVKSQTLQGGLMDLPSLEVLLCYNILKRF